MTTTQTVDNDIETTEKPRPVQKISTVTDGQLACQYCGTAADPPADPNEITWLDVHGRPGQPDTGGPEPFTVCAADAVELQRAESVLTRLPKLASLYGSVAFDKVAAVLIGWRQLDKRPPDWASFTVSDWRRWIDRMAAPAMDCHWSRQFSPILFVRRGQCSPAPYAHVGPELRDPLRRGYLDAYGKQLRAGRTRVIRPPTVDRRGLPKSVLAIADHGCLICGIGALVAEPGQPEPRWNYQQLNLSTYRKGGHNSHRVVGYACPDCDPLFDNRRRVPANRRMDHALAAFAGLPSVWPETQSLKPQPPPYAVLVADAVKDGAVPPEPSGERFGHLGGRAGVERLLHYDPPTLSHDPSTGMSGETIAQLLRGAGYDIDQLKTTE